MTGRRKRERLGGALLALLLLLLLLGGAAGTSLSTARFSARVITFVEAPVALIAPAPSSEALSSLSEPEVPAGVDPPERRAISLEAPEVLRADVSLDRASPDIAASMPALAAPVRRPVLGGAEGTENSIPQRTDAIRPGERARFRAPVVSRSSTVLPVPGPRARRGIPQLDTPLKVPRRDDTVESFPVPVDSVEAFETDPGELTANTLREWVRARQQDLPPVVSLHMDGEDGDLTTSLSYAVDGAQYEIFLQVRAAVDQIHVLLVHQEQSWYFVDRSFSRRAGRVRTGKVTRANGTIQRIVSSERNPTDREATQFYDLFLAWWHSHSADR